MHRDSTHVYSCAYKYKCKFKIKIKNAKIREIT